MALQAVDTHLVVALHALLEERSVTGAAKRLGVTQPTMSHALARLRAHFDDAILVKVGRTMTMTERARTLAEPTRAAIHELERVFRGPDAFEPLRSKRTFRLAATDNLELIVMPKLARVLAKEAPFVDLRCRSVAADWSDALLRGDIELKLGRAASPIAGIRSQGLVREELVCLVRRKHPATRRPLTRARYASFEHLVVAPHGGDHGIVDRELAARGLTRRVTMTVSHFLVAPFIVAESDLVLTIPARVAKALASPLDLATLPCPLPLGRYGLAMAWAARSENDAGHLWLRNAIRRVVAA